MGLIETASQSLPQGSQGSSFASFDIQNAAFAHAAKKE